MFFTSTHIKTFQRRCVCLLSIACVRTHDDLLFRTATVSECTRKQTLQVSSKEERESSVESILANEKREFKRRNIVDMSLKIM